MSAAKPGAMRPTRSPKPSARALPSVAATSTSSTVELLFVAVASWDTQSGAPIGGFLLATSGAGFDVVRSYSGDAPTALAWEDDTIYVGTAGGQLSYRDANGLWNDESGLPAHTTITSLVPLGGGADHPAGDILDALHVAHAGAAVFLNDQCHCFRPVPREFRCSASSPRWCKYSKWRWTATRHDCTTRWESFCH